MEKLIDRYQEDSTDPVELEIRYKDIDIETLENLLRYATKQYNVEHLTFIDAIDYRGDNKFGTRAFLTNGKRTNTEVINKESIERVVCTNPVGKYSVDLSIERTTRNAGASNDPKNIILKHRYSYILPQHKEWRVDISISKASELTSEGIKKSVQTFFTNISNIDELFEMLRKKKSHYDFKVEIEHIGTNRNDITVDVIKDISILPFKVMDSNVEVKLYFNKELNYVKNIINPSSVREITSLKSLLPSVKTITRQDYNSIYPPLDYMLTDKRDGIRTLITLHDGVLSLLSDKEKIIRRTVKSNSTLIAEGEAIRDDLIIIFDIMIVDNDNVISKSIDERFELAPRAVSILNKLAPDITFREATYYSLSNPQRYKSQFEDMYKHKRDYEIDGLILAKKGDDYLHTVAYKWKPAERQTIDFLVRKCPEELLGKKHYAQRHDHTLYLLFVGASIQNIHNLRLPYIDGYRTLFNIPQTETYKPIAFSTPLIPLSYLYYHPNTDDNKDIDGKVMEMICNEDSIQYIGNQYIINWKIIKSRDDKIGKEYGNNYITAFSSFMNIIDPFPIEYLYQGMPSDDIYFKNTGSENNAYSAMRGFMSYVKAQLISNYANKVNSVLDLGTGRGADLRRYIQLNSIGTVIVSDVNKAAITELFSRWLDIAKKSRTMINSSLRGVIMNVNDPAQENINRITSIIQSSYVNTIFCHHALHYFLESLDSIHNLAKLCSGLTIQDSHIVFTYPNGKNIFDKIGKNDNWTAIENDIIKYKIEKLYDDKKFEPAGQKVNVLLPFSKGQLYEEFLVNTDAIVDVFSEYGLKEIVRKDMDTYFPAYEIHHRQAYERLTPPDKEDISLYSVLVFKKVS